MKICDADSINARGRMGKESSGMEPRPQHENQNLQNRRKTKTKMEG